MFYFIMSIVISIYIMAYRAVKMMATSSPRTLTVIATTAAICIIAAWLGINSQSESSQHDHHAIEPGLWFNKNDPAIWQTRARTVHPTTTDDHRIHTFVAFDDDGRPYRVGVDSFAEISLISPKMSDRTTNWTRNTGCGISMRGLGGKRVASETVTMKFRAQWAAPCDEFELVEYDTPFGVDILLGLDIQDKLGTIIDRPRGLVKFEKYKLNIKTEHADEVTQRYNSQPITVVATNAGCNFAYAAVRNAGF